MTFRAAASGDTGNASALTASAVIPASGAGGIVAAGDFLTVSVSCERTTIIPTLSGIPGLTIVKSEASTESTHVIATKRIAPSDLAATVTATVSAGRRMAIGLIVEKDVADPVWVHQAYSLNTPGATTVVGPNGTTAAASSSLLAVHNIFTNAAPWVNSGTPEAGWTEVVDRSSGLTTGANGQVYAAVKDGVASGVTDGHTMSGSAVAKPGHFSSLAVFPPAGGSGIVVVDSTVVIWRFDFTSSTGDVTLAHTSGPVPTSITEIGTDVFDVVVPTNRTQPTVLTATAAGTPNATSTVTIPTTSTGGVRVWNGTQWNET